MPFAEALSMLEYAREQEDELKLFARWVVGYQSTTTFKEFKNKLLQGSQEDTRTADEILQSVELLMESF